LKPVIQIVGNDEQMHRCVPTGDIRALFVGIVPGWEKRGQRLPPADLGAALR
jgi:hypothetical protein